MEQQFHFGQMDLFKRRDDLFEHILPGPAEIVLTDLGDEQDPVLPVYLLVDDLIEQGHHFCM